MRILYTLLLYLLMPLILLRLFWRSRREPGYMRFVGERFGYYDLLANTPLIWIHAVSVGETRAAQPLIAALMRKYPQHWLLLSHMTPTGRETGRALYGPHVTRCYIPYDYPAAVTRFLNFFNPSACILIETELWPNLIRACRKRGIPVYLANARLSKKSAGGYRRVGRLARATIAALSGVAAQSADDAERLKQLGAADVRVTGNLKFDVTPPAGYLEQGRALRELFGAGRPVLLAASTREGEESLLLDQLEAIAVPDLLVVIVPRHPQRSVSVTELIARRGFKMQRRAENVPIAPDTRIVFSDSLGEMYAFYAACDVAFVGGSLLPFGGHNLIEGCAAGKPVLVGPSMFNFEEAAAQAVQCGAAIQVRDAAGLAREATRLLMNPEAAHGMGEAGLAFCAAHRGATDRILEIIHLQEPVKQWRGDEADG